MRYDFLDMSYNELILEYPEVDEFDSGRKCAAFIENNRLDSYSDESTILVYYDCIRPDRPLMVVERVDDNDRPAYDVTLGEFMGSLEGLHRDYIFHCDVSESGGYTDLVAVKRNVYEAICEMDRAAGTGSDGMQQ